MMSKVLRLLRQLLRHSLRQKNMWNSDVGQQRLGSRNEQCFTYPRALITYHSLPLHLLNGSGMARDAYYTWVQS